VNVDSSNPSEASARQVATSTAPTDTLTVIAISALAFMLSNVLHEGLGHGGTCLLVGGKPLSLTAVYFDHDPVGLSEIQSRLIAAGGPIVNLITGIAGMIALRTMKRAPGPGRYLLWLLATLGLFMATGYLLFSGVGGIGDLATVTKGLQPAWMWRLLLAMSGAVLYMLSAVVAVAEFGRFAGPSGAALVARASRIALISYVTGAVVICAAGILNPQGFIFVLISAASSTLGGASGLLWMMRMLRGPRVSRANSAELMLPRSWGWIVTAGVALLAYVVILGPGIKF
jgi:hypothetical protein